ncbi:phytanoyl-CoA dioxygenase family protein [Sneathiella chinensis]|uniref:Phytanoyl-CoA dioxygenase n=1 Tax=Sneathiella chinensis TaxID=349750 RepID=A0ABQ5U0K8_9PROT|nr:phytanoyl-CoA dioxygenase family protein [Sneathiella chinensis]GLQ05647.1 hypothetical protein GCM10007924_08680 [Sneathiella chinensis]
MPSRDRADYWAALCPELTIGQSSSQGPVPFSDADLERISEVFWEKGYLYLPPLLEREACRAIAQGMKALKSAGEPVPYIYLFDQPWQLFERLRVLIRHFLGPDYAVLPNLWAWYLDQPGQAGWPPHRDCSSETVFGAGADQILMSLSLWVPLDQATEENGCMYVVPRQQEALLQEPLTTDSLMPIATPLPADAGAVLGWPQDLVHWGGQYGEGAENPRVSLSFEFQSSHFDPLAEPLLHTDQPPTFAERLSLIEQQFDKYRHIAGL